MKLLIHQLRLLLTTLIIIDGAICVDGVHQNYYYECRNGFCQKASSSSSSPGSSLQDGENSETLMMMTTLDVCRLRCNQFSSLWPYPTGRTSIDHQKLITITSRNIEINIGAALLSAPIGTLLTAASKQFQQQIETKTSTNTDEEADDDAAINNRLSGRRHHHPHHNHIQITFNITDTITDDLSLTTNENYTVLMMPNDDDDQFMVTISSETFFGARHGLVTLQQLVVAASDGKHLQIPQRIHIEDGPRYPYRGVMLDTARNYISPDAIKRQLIAMAASKLNRFHWHLTDSHSFPYVIDARPELAHLGAYSPQQIYTAADVKDIVRFALERGIKVVPEFDAPAHVGEGWQNTSFLVCFNKQPWQDFCVEPPCGQFDPTQDALYDYLRDIYKAMVVHFRPDVFHMGGDEVDFRCWQSTGHITDWMKKNQIWSDDGLNDDNFLKVWATFQKRALGVFNDVLLTATDDDDDVYHQNQSIPIILWTSELTKSSKVLEYLPPTKYVIQVWSTTDDVHVQQLLKNGYRLILSNHDALYLDCGFTGWVDHGNNWCSPFIGWQKVYENRLDGIADNVQHGHQILGSEAALWTEQVDSSTVDGRLWPRAAALAERLWSNPTNTTWRHAEQRFLHHRSRLVSFGIRADAIQPQWCMHYQNSCPLHKLDGHQQL